MIVYSIFHLNKQVMKHVRLPLLSRDYLLQRVDCNELFNRHPICKDYVIEALKFHLAGAFTCSASAKSLAAAGSVLVSAFH